MQFFIDNSIYVPLAVAVAIVVGLLIYVSRIDNRLRKLENSSR